MYQDLDVIDFHCHFPAAGDISMAGGGPRTYTPGSAASAKAQYLKEQAERYRADWRLAWDFPEPEQEAYTPEHQADRWLAELDKYGISRVGFATGGGNDVLASVVARYPDRFIGFAHHNLWAPGAAEELERAITQLGLKGLKILAPALERPVNECELYPIWEVCERLGIPVLIHFGMLGAGGGISWNGRDNPGLLEQVAKDFPTVEFVVPHFGIQYVKELLFLCWACQNVNVDSSGSNQWIRWMPYPLTLEDLFRKFYETVGPSRIVYGSDSSWFPRGYSVRYLQDQLRACRFANMSHDDLQKIFGGNAKRLFGLE
ncbi:MAG: amidohydrolase family protein [Chloroflexota bacterium]